MDNAQDFILTWNVIKHSFSELRKSQSYTDVTLVSDDGFKITAHKVILSAGSQFFNDIFIKSNHQDTFIYLKGVKMGELECLIDFIYNGEVSIGQDELESFLKTAHDLRVKGIEKKLVKSEDMNEGNELDDSLNLDNDLGVSYPHHEGFKNDRRVDLLKQEHRLQNDPEMRFIEENKDAISISQKYKFDDNETLKPTEEIEMKEKFHSLTKNKNSTTRKRELFKCQQCDFTANRPSRLKVHTEFIHLGIKYSCTQCEYETKAAFYLKQHIQNIHDGIRYPCEHCEYKGGSLKKLGMHIKSKHEGVQYPCDKCERKYTLNENLRKHQKAKHESVRFPCNQCDYQAPVKHYLQIHIENMHEGIKKYSCDHCDYKTGHRSSMRKHREKHEGIEPEKGVCSLCGHILKSNANLRSHMTSVHGGSKYFCENCPFNCSVKSNFLRHIQLKHSSDV